MEQKKDYGELARAYFLQGYNCSQSVLLAFHEEVGLDEATAARTASSFGGGIGRLREVCGALSGILIALGMLRGYSDPKDDAAKKAQYELSQERAGQFSDRHGSYLCRDLLGLDHKSDVPTPAARTSRYYSERPCPDLVADAARILAQRLGL